MRQGMIIAAGMIVLFSGALLTAGWYFYNVAVLRRKKDFLRDNPDLPRDTHDETWGIAKVWLEKQGQEQLEIKSSTGLRLRAIYLAAPGKSDKTVILVHGYVSRAKGMAFLAQYYHEVHGFNVVMPDLRGHGESEGNYIGFGWHDRQDLIQWIQSMVDQNEGKGKILLHGISMGGATVLMTSGEKLPANVKGIISDCAYTSAGDILTHQLKQIYQLPAFPLLPITSLICKLRAGYFFSEASALAQVAKSDLPILFIHGIEDKFVPAWMVHPLYEAAKSNEKRLFLVENAGHGNAYWKDTVGYQRHVEDFIDRHMKS